MINIGLIGYGLIGKKRLDNLPKNFNLIGCADPRISKRDFNNKIFLSKNWEELIKLKNLNAVIIATTHTIQSEIILESLKKNLHVFVEKPAGVSAKFTKKIISFLKKKKLILKVGFNHRFHPSFIKAQQLIKQNGIGDIMYLRAIYGHGGRLDYNKEWRFIKKFSGGGELIDKGSHLIDLSRLFLGNLKIVSHKLKTYFWKMNLEDNCFLILKNEKENLAFLHSSCTEWKNKFIFEIFGKTGKIEINGLGKSYGTEKLKYFKMSKEMGPPKVKEYVFKKKDNSWKIELEDFYLDIVKKRIPNPNIYDAYENLKIINQIYRKK